MARQIIIKGEAISADLLLWRLFGIRGRELVNALYQLNPGLALLGPILPEGTSVIVPDLPPSKPFTARKVVTLFG